MPESLLLKAENTKKLHVQQLKKGQRYQLAEHILVDSERMMKTASTGLPLAGDGKTQFCCHSKRNRMESRLISVGLLIIVRK